MNILYPRLPLRWLPAMLKHAVLGAVLAGAYGSLHDEITYSISHEYFASLKFPQFCYLDFGLPPKAYVAEIGFVAAACAGFFAGWFLARVTVPASPPRAALRRTFHGLLAVWICSFAASALAYLVGISRGPHPHYAAWGALEATAGILDLPGFVRVAYIHNASYIGALIGLVAAVLWLRRTKATDALPGG